MTAPSFGDIRWLTALMHVLLDGSSVSYRVRTKGWADDGCIGVDMRCDGWRKHLRVPIAQIQAEDIRAVLRGLAGQTEGALLVQERSIQMLESDRIGLGLVH